ncbi:MAG TPA: hypothetical protein VKT78_19270 [Fimbriimonadaceae bacterium]|nr:hypothetical protein [Fimbriimonadaceae bacterium]
MTLAPFWLGLGLSSLLAYPIFRLLIVLNSRQKVSEYAPETHRAKQGTPTMGGLIFVIPFLIIAPLLAGSSDYWLFYGSTGQMADPRTNSPWLINAILVFLFAAIGFLDDFVVPRLMPGKRGLGWKQKLAMQFGAALLFGWLRADRGVQLGFDVFVILACANAYNFADGLDGLAASIGLLLIPGLVAVSALTKNYALIQLLALAAGAMLPFAFLNAPKAKVFMGDVGSLPLGALIGSAAAIPLGPPPNHSTAPMLPNLMVGVGVLLLVLAVELLPVPLQILWVKLFKRRLFPFTPIHHAFEKAGWQETRVVAMFALGQLVCTLASISILGVSLPEAPKVLIRE